MFSYFVPRGESIESCGIAYAIDQRARQPAESRDVLRGGPNGDAGTIFSHCPAGYEIGYFPNRQHWEPLDGSLAWIGHDQGVAWNAELLARPTQLQGLQVPLNGTNWIVPTARNADIVAGELRYSIALPRSLRFVGGEWQYGSVERQYRRLFDLATRWYELRIAAETNESGELQVGCTVNDMIGWSCEILGFNYRVGAAELSLMEAFNQYNWSHVLDAAVDWERFVSLVQKKTTRLTDDITTTVAGSPG